MIRGNKLWPTNNQLQNQQILCFQQQLRKDKDDTPVTEGWAVLNGITWLWNKGLKKVIIQCDSKKVVDWIEGGDLPNGPMRNIIVQCRAWIKKDWEISIQHILREQNRVADRLAKRMRQGSTRWTEWDNPPLDVVDLLLEDKIGVPSNRECSIGCQQFRHRAQPSF